MKKILLLCIIIFSGCAFSPKNVQSWKSELPDYMKENLGSIQTEISLRCLFSIAWVEEDGVIHLGLFATKDIFFHESMHSFEVNRLKNSPKEYDKFLSEFIELPQNKMLEFLGFIIPLQWIPVKNAPNAYTLTNHWEHTAETFRYWMLGRKVDSDIVKSNMETVRKFVTGGYSRNLTKCFCMKGK